MIIISLNYIWETSILVKWQNARTASIYIGRQNLIQKSYKNHGDILKL